MAAVSKISRDDVILPETLDVLFHLPTSKKLRDAGYIMAHAIQYNVCVKAASPEEAIQKLAVGVISRCKLTVERGNHPINMAPEDYMKAFFMGTPVKENRRISKICTKLSEELKERFNIFGKGKITIEIRMRTVVEKQRELGLMRITDLVAQAA